METVRDLLARLGPAGALWNAADAVEALMAQERAVDDLEVRLALAA